MTMGSIIIDGWKGKSYWASWNNKQSFVINPTMVSAMYQESVHNNTNDERDGDHFVTHIVVNETLEILTFADLQDIVNLMIEKKCLVDCRTSKESFDNEDDQDREAQS